MKSSTPNLRHALLSALCFMFLTTHGYAQSDTDATINRTQQENQFWKNVRFGGGFGLGTGNGFFSGTLAPNAVYQFNKDVALGLGLNATYNSRKNFYKSTILGGSILGLFNPIREIQASIEFEELNVNRKYERDLNLDNENYWYPALFLGAGYRSNNFIVGIRYDVIYDQDRSVYPEAWMPFVRVFF